MLPAQEGDFFWLTYGEETKHHILIDGGVEDCGKKYETILKYIEKNKEKVDAIILTHVDNDHIEGALDGLGRMSAESLGQVVEKILFNTGRGIAEKFSSKREEYVEDQIMIHKHIDAYGIGEGIAFDKLLEEKNLREKLVSCTMSGDIVELSGGAKLRVISPGEEQLKNLLDKWEKYISKHNEDGYSTNLDNVRKDLKDLMKEKLLSDTSVNNLSSIAFIFEYEEKKIAFLADALPRTCIKGLQQHGITEEYPVDILKISHHSSRSNTSDELLKKLKTNNYLISTNGKGQKVPSKVVIAHLLKNHDDSNQVNILCNYAWWDGVYQGEYFTDKDNQQYINTKKLVLKKLKKSNKVSLEGVEVLGGIEEICN